MAASPRLAPTRGERGGRDDPPLGPAFASETRGSPLSGGVRVTFLRAELRPTARLSRSGGRLSSEAVAERCALEGTVSARGGGGGAQFRTPLTNGGCSDVLVAAAASALLPLRRPLSGTVPSSGWMPTPSFTVADVRKTHLDFAVCDVASGRRGDLVAVRGSFDCSVLADRQASSEVQDPFPCASPGRLSGRSSCGCRFPTQPLSRRMPLRWDTLPLPGSSHSVD